MRDYFLGLILFAFFGSVILSVAPSGLGRGYLKFLCALCSIGCIMFPLASIAYDTEAWHGDIENMFETEELSEENSAEIYNSLLDRALEINVENELKAKIITETKAECNDVDVDIILGQNGDEFYIDSIEVVFYPSGYDIDPRKVEKICFSEFGCKCKFFYR